MDDRTMVDINSIKPDPYQPRKIFDKGHITGLAQSLLQEGMINAIEVDENMMIVTGECRWKAAQKNKWSEVPITVKHGQISPYERLRHQIAENVHQSGSTYATMMNPIDVARGYARIAIIKALNKMATRPGQVPPPDLLKVEMEITRLPDNRVDDKYHTTMKIVMTGAGKGGGAIESVIKEMANELGIDDSTIYEHIALLSQPKFVQEALHKGDVPRTYIREADKAPTGVRIDIKKKIVAGDYLSRDEVSQDVELSKKIPYLARIELEREKSKQSSGANRILISVAKLALSLGKLPYDQVDIREKELVRRQLYWIKARIDQYLSTIPELKEVNV